MHFIYLSKVSFVYKFSCLPKFEIGTKNGDIGFVISKGNLIDKCLLFRFDEYCLEVVVLIEQCETFVFELLLFFLQYFRINCRDFFAVLC